MTSRKEQEPSIIASVEGSFGITDLTDITQANLDGSTRINIGKLLAVMEEAGVTTSQDLVLRVNPSRLLTAVDAYSGSVALGNAHLIVDFDCHLLELDGVPCKLRATPFRYAAALARHPDRVLSPSALLNDVYGTDAVNPNNIHLNIGYIRTALGEPYGDSAKGIFQTVRGAGYKAVTKL